MALHVEQLEFGFRGEKDVKNYAQLHRVKSMLMNLPEEDLQDTPPSTRLLDFFQPDSVFIYTTDGFKIYGYIMIETPRSRSATVIRKWSDENQESERFLSDAAWAVLQAHQIGSGRKKVKAPRRHTKRRRSKY